MLSLFCELSPEGLIELSAFPQFIPYQGSSMWTVEQTQVKIFFIIVPIFISHGGNTRRRPRQKL
ncbi:hypothetical protein COCC4DRAFT_31354 [Bipolaris maydis ATCC 48331]|uniref:Uncharacterized protein n=2 Tax=Cochliobolus heterostrophus TaxID=5016 RepID=M2UHL9_COCH5|nr:uncharacterized protein COCC4DRAFT_31354 [Bipolaris maydis ATCC 48331]EMD87437.1 hypothetical protein COCHEDRAFT_1023549 [Bipolaris maydis C5]ENI06637.1 hypothetical protein COCC4DRAFT_31354 [Bipolaris maydis ATCC 48331]